MRLFDTHAHLDDEAFAHDLQEVLQRAQSAGVVGILAVGITLASSESAIRLAENYGQVWAAVGIHPNYAASAQPGDWSRLERLVEHPRVVAVGETGLDRYWHYTPFEVQEDYFLRHLALARAANRPVVIHCRDAEEDLLRVLRADYEHHGPLRGILHAFSGQASTAEVGLSLGLHVSFAGMVTYKNAEPLRQLARRIPADRLLVETDSPYLVPVPLRGRISRNEPAHVIHTVHCLARVRQTDAEQLAQQCTANAQRLFGLGQNCQPGLGYGTGW
ncbi:MAG: TatD family hydrolase [Gemmatales bacterium]|nr:TatD family hydrolase [Gemmatales bacterium]MDW7994337.1 TatD family hydrolase [Gemmatales bacterium]